MLKLLKGVHLGVVLLLALYSGEETTRWIIKVVEPSNESLRFWRPGIETPVLALGFLLLLGILSCSVGLIKHPSSRVLMILCGTWLICFTWFGWLRPDAPFRLHELVRVDPNNTAAVQHAEWAHLAWSATAYLAISVAIVFPLLSRKLDSSTHS